MAAAPAAAPAVEIVMPALGISVAEGTLVAWRKRPGDEVDADEAICDIASDKIDSEVPAPCRGRLATILVADGETVPVGTVLGTLVPTGAPTAAGNGAAARGGGPAGGGAGAGDGGAGAGEGNARSGAVTADPEPRRSRGREGPEGTPGPRRPRHSPVVRRIADELGIDLDSLHGTGLGGRVRKQDVLAAAAGSVPDGGGPPGKAGAAAAAEPPYAAPAAGELSRMRRLIGEHMKRSLDTAATVTSWIEVDFSAVERRRRELGVTALPLVAQATAATLARFGELNAWLDGDRHTRHEEVNLGIAVALGADGLVVPVLRGAQRLSLGELAERIADLAARARAGALSPDELHDGTFTITNPGQFGTVMATPVINQPQVAILDVEAIVRRPVVIGDEHGGESIGIRPICVLGLSWDHRALDGAYAARFLAALRDRLQTGG